MSDPKPRHKLAIGVAYGGKQDPEFWGPISALAANFPKIGVEYIGVLHAGSMMVDGNRNNIANGLLESQADWLLWIDTDNVFKLGAVKRLLDMRKTLCSGVYVGKQEPNTNIAYRRVPETGMYRPVSEFEDYYKGEIIPIDMAGMGFCLSHRSVYEDMQKQFTVLQDSMGHFWPIHKDDIRGEVSETAKHPYDWKVHKGQLRIRMRPVSVEPQFHPWFQMRFGKTEDVIFFENAARAGHKAWLDTSLEAKHFGNYDYTPEDRNRWPENTDVIRHPRDYEVKYAENKPEDEYQED
jgi:hypothetical protein